MNAINYPGIFRKQTIIMVFLVPTVLHFIGDLCLLRLGNFLPLQLYVTELNCQVTPGK